MKSVLKFFLRFLLVVLWIVISIILGGVFLSVKETMGLNFFNTTGYHAFSRCLVSESEKAFQENIIVPTKEAKKRK